MPINLFLVSVITAIFIFFASSSVFSSFSISLSTFQVVIFHLFLIPYHLSSLHQSRFRWDPSGFSWRIWICSGILRKGNQSLCGGAAAFRYPNRPVISRYPNSCSNGYSVAVISTDFISQVPTLSGTRINRNLMIHFVSVRIHFFVYTLPAFDPLLYLYQ